MKFFIFLFIIIIFICGCNIKEFTGRFNPTKNCAYKNNNKWLILKSNTISGNYKNEFNELQNDYTEPSS